MRSYLLQPDTHDNRDYNFTTCSVSCGEQLPVQVDLRPDCSPVVKQGILGSCTANAIVSGLREYLLLKDKQPLTRLSRLFLYYEERALEGTTNRDSGASIRSGMKVLSTIGVCPEANKPYNVTSFKQPPTGEQIKEAAKFKVQEYHRVTSLYNLKVALAEGLPVVMGLKIFASFEGDKVAKMGIVSVPDLNNEACLGGHAVCVVGYDDSRSWCIVRNSWGTDWGDGGYFYLPYQMVTPQYIVDMWTSKG